MKPRRIKIEPKTYTHVVRKHSKPTLKQEMLIAQLCRDVGRKEFRAVKRSLRLESGYNRGEAGELISALIERKRQMSKLIGGT